MRRTLISGNFLAAFSPSRSVSLYGRKSFCLHEKLPPKMVNSFGSTCVLLWSDFLAFIYYFIFPLLFFHLCMYNEMIVQFRSAARVMILINISLFYFAVRVLLFLHVSMGRFALRSWSIFPPLLHFVILSSWEERLQKKEFYTLAAGNLHKFHAKIERSCESVLGAKQTTRWKFYWQMFYEVQPSVLCILCSARGFA